MGAARVRFGLFWISQVARVMADWALRITVFQVLLSEQASAWHLVTALFIFPSIALAPFFGSISNSFPKRNVLVIASAFCTLFAVALMVWESHWLSILVLTAVASALYGPTRFALLPAIAKDAKVALPRIVAWTDMGSTAAIVGGFTLGFWLYSSLAQLLLLIVVLNVVSTLMAMACRFPSDIRRSEGPIESLRGFFRDSIRVKKDRLAWGSLLGLGCFQGLVTAGSGTLVTQAVDPNHASHSAAISALMIVCGGVALGCMIASLQPHIRRCLGLVSLGSLGLILSQIWMAMTMDQQGIPPWTPILLLGMMSGLINAPLRASYQAAVPEDARGNAMAIMYAVLYIITALLAGLMILLIDSGWLTTPQTQMWFLTGLGVVGAVLAWKWLLGPTFDLFAEWMLFPMYRIRAHGPGSDLIPTKGPVLLIANHSSYVDPFWIGKIVPRKLTPMMTSRFFDLRFIRWLMVHVVKAIRVEASGFRREAPELQEAISALKEGKCVLLFPEGILRRKEEPILRQFGQGVWHILREVPQTPVVVLWIEGGWGSYASYKDGPPFKNKKIDRRRPIDIAVTEPQVIDPSLLEDHRTLRAYLMQQCLNARTILGLEVPEIETGTTSDSESEHTTTS